MCASMAWVSIPTYDGRSKTFLGRHYHVYTFSWFGKFSRICIAYNLQLAIFCLFFFFFHSMVLFCFTSLQEGSTSGTTLLFVVFLCSMTLGTILMCFLTKRNNNREDGLPDSSVGLYSTVVSLSKSLITLLFDVRMLLTIPLIAYSGLQQAFVW